MTFTRALSTNNYGPAKFIVDGTTTANGTHSTIAAALTSASSGDTIFIRPGTYTENLTLKAGVNLTAYGCDSSLNLTGNVKIVGKATLSTAGTVTISGIELKTNSDFFLVVSGANASIVNLNNCNLNCLNATGISFTASNTAARINIAYCWGNLGTTGIGLFSGSSTGAMIISSTLIGNTGLSTTASTISAGSWNISNCNFTIPLSTTSTATMAVTHSVVDCSAVNATALLVNGSGGGNAELSYFASGTSSAVNVGTGSSLTIDQSTLSSTNTNAMTGLGSIGYSSLAFPSTSNTINTTTQTAAVFRPGITRSAHQPAFLAFSASQSNVTGDGTAYTVTFGTEIFDQNANFDAVSTFTAPVTGRYDMKSSCQMTSTGAAITEGTYSLNTSNRNYGGTVCNPNNVKGATSLILGFYAFALADMDAADTATCVVTMTNGTKVADVSTASYFCGSLVC